MSLNILLRRGDYKLGAVVADCPRVYSVPDVDVHRGHCLRSPDGFAARAELSGQLSRNILFYSCYSIVRLNHRIRSRRGKSAIYVRWRRNG